jgi:hypothetical protein
MSSVLKYELARVEGLDFETYYSSDPRFSNKLRYDVKRLNGKIIGLVQRLGLELNNYSISYYFPDPSCMPIIGGPTFITNTASLNYSIDHRVNEKGRRIKMSVIGATKFLSDSADVFLIPTMGFSSRYDPMASELFLSRGGSSRLIGAQAPLLYGALPVDHYAENWMASVRLDYDLSKSVEVFAGVVVWDEMESDIVAGLTYSLGPLKIQMPLYSLSIMEDNGYEPFNYWRFSLNLTELNPWKMIRNN